MNTLYRIYDFERRRWADDAVILPNGNIQITKRNKWFGTSKINEYSYKEYQYSADLDTGFADIDGEEIFENDILRLGNITGLVVWNLDFGEYRLLDFKNKMHYPLWNTLCETYALIIGNKEENNILLDSMDEFKLNTDNMGNWANVLS